MSPGLRLTTTSTTSGYPLMPVIPKLLITVAITILLATPKEEQKRSCFSNQERKVENLHEWAIEVKAMGGKAVDSYHWRSNDFHVVPCDECLIVSDFLRNAVWDNQEKVFTPKRERHPYCKSPGNQPAILLVNASGISAVLMLPYRHLSPCSPGCRYS